MPVVNGNHSGYSGKAVKTHCAAFYPAVANATPELRDFPD